MVRDRIGNSLRSAFNLSNFPSSSIRRSDALGGKDSGDLYHFKLNGRSNLTLEASKTGNSKVSVQLLALKDKANALRAIGKANFNKLKARSLRQYLQPVATTTATKGKFAPISINLEAGEYYLRFFQQKKQNVRYRFNLSAFSAPGSSLSPGGNSAAPPPPGGSTGTPQPGSPSTPTNGNVAPSSAQQWVRQFGTSGTDNGYSSTIDGAGNVYVAGEMSGNGFVSKYNSSGQQLWQRTLPINGTDIVHDIAVDGAGNYYVAGAYNLSATASDGFIAKYDSNGNQLWLTGIVTTAAGAPALDAATGITIDSRGNVFAAGFLQASVFQSFQGDAFVAKLNGTTGQLMAEFGGGDGIATYNGSKSQSDAAAKVAVDSSGNVYIAGISDATLSTRTPDNLFQGGNAFVASFNSNGSLRWQNTLDSNTIQQDFARDLVVSGDAVYIAGQTTTALPGSSFAGGVDGFVAKYSTGGSRQWLKQLGTSGVEEAQAITVDGSGRIYVTGRTNQSLFGSYFGGYDVFVAIYDSNGNLSKGTQLGTLRNDKASGVAATGSGVYLTGQTEGTFAGSSAQGSADSWVARYNLA